MKTYIEWRGSLQSEKLMAYGVTAIAVIGAAAAVIGAGVSTYAAVQQAEQQADIAKEEGRRQKFEAEAFKEQAAFEEKQSRRKALIMLGKQYAIASASGVDPDMGSPIDQQIDLITQTELEALNIRAFGQRAVQSKMYDAKLSKYRADTARGTIPLSIVGGVASAVGGAASVYGNMKAPRTNRGYSGSTVTTSLIDSDW